MKLKNFGEKIEEVEREIGETVGAIKEKSSLISYMKGKLQECMVQNNVLKALAIVDYCIHNTDISSSDLSFLTTDDSVYQVSHEKGYDNFEIEFLGFCEALHYTE